MHIVDESTSVPPRNPRYDEDGGSLGHEQDKRYDPKRDDAGRDGAPRVHKKRQFMKPHSKHVKKFKR